jgi:hypothetical protein
MDLTPTHVVREDAILQCLNKASEELFEAGYVVTAQRIIETRESLQKSFARNSENSRLSSLIPNEDLATWIDG